MRNLKRGLSAIIGAFLITLSAQAQTENDAIRPFYNEFGPGARAMALGGAFTAVAEDYTATYWNPAGLAQIKKMEFHAGLGRTTNKSDINYQGTMTNNSYGFTAINSVGMVFPFPTYRGSLVFALGYNRINSYSDFNELSGSPFLTTLGKRFHQAEETSIEGSLNQWTFAGAVDISPNVSIGGSLNLLTGSNNADVRYWETDPDDILYDYNYNTYYESKNVSFEVSPEYTGVSFKMGSLFRPNPNLRLGLTITTPSYLSVEENSNYFEDLLDDSGYTYTSTDDSYRKYTIHSPWRFEIGASYKIKMLMLTGSVEFLDWSETRFSSNIYDGGEDIDAGINSNIRSYCREAVNYRLGAEAIVPRFGFKVMGGYYYQSSPYKPDVEMVASNRQFLSGGVSFLLDKQVKVDAAYQYGWWKQAMTDGLLGTDDQDNPLLTNEKNRSHKVLVSLSYRF